MTNSGLAWFAMGATCSAALFFCIGIGADRQFFKHGISTASEMIRLAARDKRFLAALRDDPAPALAMLAACIESTNQPTTDP